MKKTEEAWSASSGLFESSGKRRREEQLSLAAWEREKKKHQLTLSPSLLIIPCFRANQPYPTMSRTEMVD